MKNELAGKLNNTTGESAMRSYEKHRAKYDAFLAQINGARDLSERQVYYMFGLKLDA